MGLEATIFAFWSFFLHNGYKDEPYQIPIAYSIAAFEEAAKYPNVEPEDITTVLVAEHGGGYPYPAWSKECRKEKYWDEKRNKERKRCVVKENGEIKYIAWGLMQLSRAEVREFNEAHGTSYTLEDSTSFLRRYVPFIFLTPAPTVMDWRTNIEVGAYTISQIKHRHKTVSRCSGESKFHSWHAHYRCAVKIRDKVFWDPKDQRYEPLCKTSYRERLVKKFAKWKELPAIEMVRKLRKDDIEEVAEEELLF